jgi:coenzyme F420-dependent glucose-6-phosphate dehydrogenase
VVPHWRGIIANAEERVVLRVGYKASAEQFTPTELAAYAVRAEELGLDSVTISDHFQPWRLNGGHAPNSLAWMPWVLARTERVLVGTSVLTPTFRYNPAVLAQTFATMACLAPGRVMLGVGTGEALNEVAVGSVGEGAWPEFKERFARLRESIELMRQLWTQDRVSFAGEYYRTEDAAIYDRPEKPVPVYVAAGGPVVARYAGRVADGFICTSGKGRELYEDRLVPAVDEGLEKAGRTPDAIDRMIEVKVSWDPDPAQALENTRFWAPLSLSPEQKHSIHSPAEMEKAADELPIEQVAKRWIIASRPDDVVAAIKVYTDLGFDHLVIHGPGHDQERFLSTFADQVLPALRELIPAAR